jgi:hypothetical protein
MNHCQSVVRVNGVPLGGGGGGGSVPTPIQPGELLIGNLGGTALEWIPTAGLVEGMTQFWPDQAARIAAGSTGFSDGELGIQIDNGFVYEFVDPDFDGTGVWTYRYSIFAGTSERTGVDISFFDSGSEFLAVNQSASFQQMALFRFVGTNKFTPSEFGIIMARVGTSGTVDIWLHDISNNLEIGRITITAAPKAMYEDMTLTNLPAGPAMIEVRAQKSAGGASNGELYHISLR